MITLEITTEAGMFILFATCCAIVTLTRWLMRLAEALAAIIAVMVASRALTCKQRERKEMLNRIALVAVLILLPAVVLWMQR